MQPYSCLLQLNQFCFEQGFNRHQGVDLNDGESFDGFIASPFAAEGEVGNVDPLFAEDGSDLSDYAGDVEVAADKEIAFERRFDVDAVELKQARLFAQIRCREGPSASEDRSPSKRRSY